MQKFINNFETLTSTALTGVDTDVSVDIPAADAVRLGALTAPDYYLLTLSLDSNSNPDYTEVEIIKVTGVNPTTGELTIIRGYEGTTVQAWAGSSVTRAAAYVSRDTLVGFQAGGVTITHNALASFTAEKPLNGHTLICDSASAQQVALANDGDYSDADDAIPIGYRLDVVQRGAGAVKVTVSGSDDIESTLVGSPTVEIDCTGQMGIMSFLKVAVDEWLAFGDIA